MKKSKFILLAFLISILLQNPVIAKKKIVYKNDGGVITAEYKKRSGDFSIKLELNRLKGSENPNNSVYGVRIVLTVYPSDSKRYYGFISYFGNKPVFSVNDKDFILMNDKHELAFSNLLLVRNLQYTGDSKPYMQFVSFEGSDAQCFAILKDSKSLFVKEAGNEKYPGWSFSELQLELLNRFITDYVISSVSPNDIFN